MPESEKPRLKLLFTKSELVKVYEISHLKNQSKIHSDHGGQQTSEIF